ncbi:MAG: transposase [Candidatus Aminicenantes bacterium]|nr:transposase [Candidatus Aminicenantes bacterium]
MRRVRLTFEGAYHHAMNRGINGEEIFTQNQHKSQFLDLLRESSNKFKIRILAYCIMQNHYHLILENSSGKMSEFFRHLNGQYGKYYRMLVSEKGYVFQSRFKSTLIQDDSYLKTAIGYVLLNPVRAGIVPDFRDYPWSSANHHFSKQITQIHGIVDSEFVNKLFESEREFLTFVTTMDSTELPVRQSRYGGLLGGKNFLETAISRFDRRERNFGDGMKRIDDNRFEPIEKIIMEFEKKIGVTIDELKVNTVNGKRIRGELLVRLKDLGGLKYSEISLMEAFADLKLSSLPKLYKDAQKRRER